jgi:hypothetical protein
MLATNDWTAPPAAGMLSLAIGIFEIQSPVRLAIASFIGLFRFDGVLFLEPKREDVPTHGGGTWTT